MRFQNLARYPDIGSNSYLLEFGDTRVVLDAGTHPKHTGLDTLPLFERVEPGSLDAIFVSHPHLDHIGGLPVLVKQHPEAAVIMTEATRESGCALLHNSVSVMTSQKRELMEPNYPLYTHRHINEMERGWHTKGIRDSFSFGETDRVKGEFFRAGHVLGAVGIKFEHEGETAFYTGDVHFEDQTLTMGADFPTEGIDTLIIETTRGEFPRDPDYTRASEKQRLGETIERILSRGGSIMIPVFAFGKTQELLLMLHELRGESVIPHVPVHIGGLSTKMTTIADRLADMDGRFHRNFRILEEFEDLHILARGRAEPEFHPGTIYALSSGMMSEHTVSHRFARHILSSPEHALLFVGYADSETPGGKILAAGQGGSIQLNQNSPHETPIQCEVDRFDFSGHSPRNQLADYAVKCRPKKVILVHGDAPARTWFKQELEQRLPDSEIIIPQPGQWVE